MAYARPQGRSGRQSSPAVTHARVLAAELARGVERPVELTCGGSCSPVGGGGTIGVVSLSEGEEREDGGEETEDGGEEREDRERARRGEERWG
jgi:hypothetical protein